MNLSAESQIMSISVTGQSVRRTCGWSVGRNHGFSNGRRGISIGICRVSTAGSADRRLRYSPPTGPNLNDLVDRPRAMGV